VRTTMSAPILALDSTRLTVGDAAAVNNSGVRQRAGMTHEFSATSPYLPILAGVTQR
jgi:hypothetical protein